jgi:uncharacterized protein YpmB
MHLCFLSIFVSLFLLIVVAVYSSSNIFLKVGVKDRFHKSSAGDKITRTEVLVRDFLKQVQLFHGKERRIDFYANSLHFGNIS